MRALWKYKNGILAFKEIEDPQLLSENDVKIKVMYSTIGIQDLRVYRTWDFYAKNGLAGYEMSGIIVDLGSAAKKDGFYIGQHVSGTVAKFCGKCAYCEKEEENNCLEITSNAGTICDYIVWDKNQLVPIPDDMPFSIGCLLEPVAVVYHAFRKAAIKKGENICIFGGDFNGLVLLQLAKQAGAKTVTLVEPKEVNQKLARQLGADFVVDPREDTYKTELMKLSDFIGFQSVVLTSSHPEWLSVSTDLVARGGTIMLMVYYDLTIDFSINSIKFFLMNIKITSSFLYTKKELVETLAILHSLDLHPLIHLEFPMKDSLTAFDVEQKFHYPRIGLTIND
ncbi:zinc-dependent alcohol dehydrogenase [Gorillibacterium timonense]|uniref:zinc-dependent alcohol dehydrogenase n=1 Tax=Gorillibacterium timonense TaxID=1689269 RepID=UPI00071D48BC|nr:zinc-binding dehydrogenase [Gorillibacterium timonense]